MNSTINLITTDVDKSTVVVHKDGADVNVPVKNMIVTTLNKQIISGILGLSFLTGQLENLDNFLVFTGSYNTTNLGISLVDLNAIDPNNYALGEWGFIGNVSLSLSNCSFSISPGLKTAAQTLYFGFEPDIYNNFGGKQFIKYTVYDNTGAIVINPGNLLHSILFIQTQ